MFFYGIQKCGCLQKVAACIVAAFFHHFSIINGFLDRAYDQLSSQLPAQLITKNDGFLKIMPGIDVYQWIRYFGRPESFYRQMNKDDGILPAGKQQCRPFKLGSHLSQYIDRLCFQLP